MKKAISLALALLLLLNLPLPAFAEGEPLTSLETSACDAYSPYLLLEGNLLAELPEWLTALIFASYGGHTASFVDPPAGDPVPIEATPTPGEYYAHAPSPGVPAAAYEPGLYEPYTVTRRKTYYDKNGAAAYTLILSAVFVNTKAHAVCLKTQAQYEIESGSWRITPGLPSVSGQTVTAAFQVEQLFTGISVKTETVTLTLTAYDRTGNNFHEGDVDGDGRLTTADARTALRIAVGLDPLTDKACALADLTGDRRVTTADARLILRKCIGL